MDKKLNVDHPGDPVLIKLQALLDQKMLPEKYYHILVSFYSCYRQAVLEGKTALEEAISLYLFFIDLLQEQIRSPYVFELYHQKIRSPIDYYRFSLDFIRPLIDFHRSTVKGLKNLDRIQEQLDAGENAVFLANHQTEPDPQAIAILLEQTHPRLAESIVYVAGERVITDPLAIPFSMGCDLLCVYSKRYIDHPPQLKEEKLRHNKQTMERMSRLLEKGGKAIYVAPSGGRDRKNNQGKIEIAPFDPQSIEMFYLMAKKAGTPTHFYPLSLSTYDLLPPPDAIQKQLGEARSGKYSPIHLSFDVEFDMERFPGSDASEKSKRRQNRAEALWNIVSQNYHSLLEQSL